MATYQFAHDVDEVFSRLTDPDFLVQRCIDLGDLDAESSVEPNGRKTIVMLTRRVKRELPKILAKLFGDENTISIVETWEEIGSTKMGSFTADIEGQPVSLTAKFKLKPTESGCEYTADYKCKASIPLVGKKVEEFALSQTEGDLRKEMDYLTKNLAAVALS